MTIAAHISAGKKTQPSFLAKYLMSLALQKPEVHFIFFTGKNIDAPNVVSNITQVLISPKIKNSLLLHYWYNYKLPYLLKRYNADVFISENTALSSRTDTTQVMVINNIQQVKKTTLFPDKFKRYISKYLPAFIKRASRIICTEDFLAQYLNGKFATAKEKITIIHPGLSTACKPISWQQKEDIINTYTAGKDYFLFTVSAATKANILPVLKSFSQFKKWQKSVMKMVLLTENELAENLIEGFNLYKYKDDVEIISPKDVTEIMKIISAAYVLIYLPSAEYIEYNCLDAMQAEVPVIALATDLNRSMYKDAALYTTLNEKNIAEKMILLYKDEYLRNEQIKKAVVQTAKYNDAYAASQLWDVIAAVNEG